MRTKYCLTIHNGQSKCGIVNTVGAIYILVLSLRTSSSGQYFHRIASNLKKDVEEHVLGSHAAQIREQLSCHGKYLEANGPLRAISLVMIYGYEEANPPLVFLQVENAPEVGSLIDDLNLREKQQFVSLRSRHEIFLAMLNFNRNVIDMLSSDSSMVQSGGREM